VGHQLGARSFFANTAPIGGYPAGTQGSSQTHLIYSALDAHQMPGIAGMPSTAGPGAATRNPREDRVTPGLWDQGQDVSKGDHRHRLSPFGCQTPTWMPPGRDSKAIDLELTLRHKESRTNHRISPTQHQLHGFKRPPARCTPFETDGTNPAKLGWAIPIVMDAPTRHRSPLRCQMNSGGFEGGFERNGSD
jgi:hypothetical protein